MHQIRVVTHEIEHKPQGFDLRGGSTTADRMYLTSPYLRL